MSNKNTIKIAAHFSSLTAAVAATGMDLSYNESYRRAVNQARAMAAYGTSASVCTWFCQNNASDLYFAREGVNHLKYNVIHRYYSEGFKNENLELDSDDYQAAYGL